MPKPIINLADVELQSRPPQLAPQGAAAQRFEARIGRIGPQIGAKKLGCSLTAVPPGKRAFPFHNHRLNEEMFYVIEGSGEVRSAPRPTRSAPATSSPALPAALSLRTRSSTPAP